ncbi:stress response protein NST1-like [Trifolium medium]|uniref:Stress response protein NST1-like n=1 Tax=Trifolium medium TaxID=97028 RepID=A0A392LZS3_9FABA|nr:stress response protein NST1-like [Trifolium medium]
MIQFSRYHPFFHSSSSIILTLFLFSLRKPSSINPKPDFTRNPETHDPINPSPSDSQLHYHHQPSEDDPTPILLSDTAPPFPNYGDPNPTLESGQTELKNKKKRKTKKRLEFCTTLLKADATQRKFVITKALLYKADRSSFDRLRQQIYKLELEQKRLEEDAFVYNWLQHQLKLSPAYKKQLHIPLSIKMLEIGVSMENNKACKEMGNQDNAQALKLMKFC